MISDINANETGSILGVSQQFHNILSSLSLLFYYIVSSTHKKRFSYIASSCYVSGGGVQHTVYPRAREAARSPLSGLQPQASSQPGGLCVSGGISDVGVDASLRQLCPTPCCK